jgi:hypothetical protein
MGVPDFVDRALPAPRADEPARLRERIAAELADHLACATADEVERGADPARAQRRAVERFGDPGAVARRLWWNAMKEAVMKDRILMGAAALAALACLGALALTWQSLRQNQRMNEKLIAEFAAMRTREPAPAPVDPAWRDLSIRVTRGSQEGPPAVGASVTLSGRIFGEDGSFTEKADANGLARFGVVRSGNSFECQVNPPDGFEWFERSYLRTGPPLTHAVVIPELVPIQLSLNWPDEAVGKPRVVSLWLSHNNNHDDPAYADSTRSWLVSPQGILEEVPLHQFKWDADTGLDVWIKGQDGSHSLRQGELLEFKQAPLLWPAGRILMKGITILRGEQDSSHRWQPHFDFVVNNHWEFTECICGNSREFRVQSNQDNRWSIRLCDELVAKLKE